MKIYIDRLTNGKTEEIDESLPPDFLDIDEGNLSFSKPVKIKGEAYIATDELILKLDIETFATIPCKICSEDNEHPIQIKSFYLTEDLEKIKAAVYDYASSLREAILLEIPPYVECEGNCPEREKLEKYLNDQGDETTHPFSSL